MILRGDSNLVQNVVFPRGAWPVTGECLGVGSRTRFGWFGQLGGEVKESDEDIRGGLEEGRDGRQEERG